MAKLLKNYPPPVKKWLASRGALRWAKS